jgi:hypothetical protein
VSFKQNKNAPEPIAWFSLIEYKMDLAMARIMDYKELLA